MSGVFVGVNGFEQGRDGFPILVPGKLPQSIAETDGERYAGIVVAIPHRQNLIPAVEQGDIALVVEA